MLPIYKEAHARLIIIKKERKQTHTQMFKQLATLGLVASLSQAVNINRKGNGNTATLTAVVEEDCYADWNRRWEVLEEAQECCSSGGFVAVMYSDGYGCVSFGLSSP